ncbi:hypothetical protein CPLU01_12337 [Colletotrichum plurivorum]|uniref:Secreted protein n=2 Tax=Colletotrichum orchidearum species complex TaxID=2707337 RepID=A0A8H6JYN9_9PEZI|nr:hypothetical protein CSOJ01_07794 [Colletotrichum sojae]KAF6821889.1 hypothetical protein CPLU01_12337 [Colletotrichum plurivorum]
MRFSIFTVLCYVAGTHAWAQAADGTWVANNVVHNIYGSQVHEACTRMNTNDILVAVDCAYWIDGRGHIARGSMCHPSHRDVSDILTESPSLPL